MNDPRTSGTSNCCANASSATTLAPDAPVRVVLGLTEDGEPVESTDIEAQWEGGGSADLQTDVAGQITVPPASEDAFLHEPDKDNPAIKGIEILRLGQKTQVTRPRVPAKACREWVARRDKGDKPSDGAAARTKVCREWVAQSDKGDKPSEAAGRPTRRYLRRFA